MQRLGATFRAVRIKRGWRQIDVAMHAKVDRSVISAIERGHLESVSVGTLLRIAQALEIHIGFTARWRAGDLDRLLSGRHSGLHEAVARWFATALPAWVLAPEVSYSIFGERGVIDILAWHPGRRALLVIELKTDIADVNELIGSMDRRGRLSLDQIRSRPRLGSIDGFDLGPRRGQPDQPGETHGTSDGAAECLPGGRSSDGRLASTSGPRDPRYVALGTAERTRRP